MTSEHESLTNPATQPDPATAQPASSNEPATPDAEGQDSGGGDAGRAGRIRIGSQRWREKNPEVRPKPVSEFLPSPRASSPGEPASLPQPTGGPSLGAHQASIAAPATAVAAGGDSVAAPSVDPAAVSDSHGHQAAAAQSDHVIPETLSPEHAQTGTSPEAAVARPAKPDGQRGRRDRQSSQERIPTFTPRKIEPPNVRASLTPDLEEELAAALGTVSVEDILSANKAQPAAAELELESRHRAQVVAVQRGDVFVDLGSRREGILPLASFAEPPEPGATVEVIVHRFNAVEGLYELGLPGASMHVENWAQVSEGIVVEARVTGHNKGGLECEVNQLRGFIPASQVSIYRVEDLSQMVGQKFACVVTEANPDKRNLVLSRRAVLEREKAEAKTNLLAELEVGQTREGVVRSLQEFGAFVDLGGVDGLIHISQLSWDRIRHASEVLELGQKVKVKVQKVDPATGKISLAFRDLAENPWAGAAQKFAPRTRVTGTVTRLMEFGAFVRLAPGVEGLIHISELAHKRVFRTGDIVQEGQEVEVLVLSVDAEHQRISLSLKALEARPTPAAKPTDEPEEVEAPAPVSKRKGPLKGGIGNASGGERFGLKW